MDNPTNPFRKIHKATDQREKKPPSDQQEQSQPTTEEEEALRNYWASAEEQDRLRLEQQKLGRRCPFGGRMYGLDHDNKHRRN